MLKNYRTFLVVGCLMVPTANAAGGPDSADVMKLLADTKAIAVQLNKDSAEMDSFTRSKSITWRAYQEKVAVIKGHINNAGKLLGSLKAAESTGSPWQQQTIKRIEPQLQEMAANLTATINYLNNNQGKVHTPEFIDYVKTNYALTSDMEAMLRASIDYGTDKAKFESLSSGRD